MTELQRARAHLLQCQDMLYWERKRWPSSPLHEQLVLAALSWVWEEQQKDAHKFYRIPYRPEFSLDAA